MKKKVGNKCSTCTSCMSCGKNLRCQLPQQEVSQTTGFDRNEQDYNLIFPGNYILNT